MLLQSVDENQKACSKCEGYEGKDIVNKESQATLCPQSF